MARAGELWNHLSEEAKGPYNKLHDKDQKRHDNQVKELEEKGFFIMEDGTKSSLHEVKKKRGKKQRSASKSKSAKKVVKKQKKRASEVDAAMRSKGKSSANSD